MARIYQNFLGGETDAALTDVATSISSPALAAMVAVASPDTMTMVLDPDGRFGEPEIVEVTTHTAAATTATIIRGVDGSTARTHASGVEWVGSPVLAADIEYGGMKQLRHTALASPAASISFTSIPATFRDLVIVGELRSDRVGNDVDGVHMKVGVTTVDSGANYRWHEQYITNLTANSAATDADTKIKVATVAAAASQTDCFGILDVTLARYTDTARYRHGQSVWHLLGDFADSTGFRGGQTGFQWENKADAIDIVTFTPDLGTNFVAGSYLTLYGRGRT